MIETPQKISIGHAITFWCVATVSFSATLRVQYVNSDPSDNVITLLCEDTFSRNYVQNAEFWRNSEYRVDDLAYGAHTNPNTSATIFLTPQREGNYTCRDPIGGNTSGNHVVLLAYPHERTNSRHTYTVIAGESVTITCPFPRGALHRFYSYKWLRDFRTLSKTDSRYIFNSETFELTIVDAGFEDGTTGLSEGVYVCQVTIALPTGNSWIKDSQPISLFVSNSTEERKENSSKGSPEPTSTLLLLPSSSVVSRVNENTNRSSKHTQATIIGAVLGTIIFLLLLLIITGAIVVCKWHTKCKDSIDLEPTAPRRRSNGSFCNISDTEEDCRPQHVSEHTLRFLSELTTEPPSEVQETALNHTPQHGVVENGLRRSPDQRTPNTAASACSSLFKKPLEPRGDYSPSCDVEFVGSIQVLDCDTQGGEYRSKEHSIRVRIPNDPFKPADNRMSAELEIGVAIHGHVTFPENLRPVSPILWLNVAGDFRYEFGKFIEIELPHYLQLLTTEEISGLLREEQLGWMYATTSDPEEAQLAPMEFTRGDARSFCFMQKSGKIKTKHSSYMCLCATRSCIEARATYCLVTAVQRPISGHSPEQAIFFFVCYNLNTFIEVIRNELKTRESFTDSSLFVFSSSDTAESSEEAKISVHVGKKSASKGWQLTLQTDTTEVTAKAVELWANDLSDLRLRLQHRRYPPRVKLVATASGKAQNSQEVFTVSGARFLDRKHKFSVPLRML
jgi:hypothetical protein